MTSQLLFLCTGNYYRSRFAEHLFNSLAERHRVNWRATSRGVATEFGVHNVGPISSYALAGLRERGVSVERNLRMPMQLDERDLVHAHRIIALNEIEHRPQIAARFPWWANRIEYWHVPDLDQSPAAVALPAIERQVRALIEQLGEGLRLV